MKPDIENNILNGKIFIYPTDEAQRSVWRVNSPQKACLIDPKFASFFHPAQAIRMPAIHVDRQFLVTYSQAISDERPEYMT